MAITGDKEEAQKYGNMQNNIWDGNGDVRSSTVHTHTHTHTLTHIHTHAHTHAHTRTNTHTHTHAHLANEQKHLRLARVP